MGHDPHRKRAAARRGRHPAAATSAAAAGAADALLSAPPGQPTSDDDGAAASRAASDAAAAAAGRYRLPHGVAVGSRAGGGGGGGGGGEAFGMYMAEDYADLFADDAIPGLPVGPAAPPPARSAAEILAAMATLAPTVSAALPSPSAMEAAAQQADSDPPSWGKEPPSTADKGNARQYASGRALLHGAGGTSSTGGDPAGGGGGGEAGRNSAGPGKDPASRRRGENSSGGTGDTVPAGAPNAYGELPTGASRPDA
ncbi:hypothetical protein HYH03_002573 [Edaphochlamys debaryana]|uniref:Uncharacterized protein n=1 Tax=Edaphochlamys debaryana TaxID=47281 RepID=A0A835YDC8_9CHLO|nr:hypothetical protein HYH03_002573 [Edaphochlamys debaryana]|eukprot:KAG2499634.1 hypothetical protein HYH03_002573 [Edaphochlamys debaryana]